MPSIFTFSLYEIFKRNSVQFIAQAVISLRFGESSVKKELLGNCEAARFISVP